MAHIEVQEAMAEHIAKEQEAKYLLAKTQKSLSFVYESQQKFKEAYFSLKEVEILNDSIFKGESQLLVIKINTSNDDGY